MSDGPEAQWLAQLRAGRLMLQRDAAGRAVFPPRLAAPGHAGPLHWVEAAGTGTVHAVTIEHPRPPAAPRALVLVDLDEGVRMLSRMPDVAAESIRIGDRVRARIVAEAEIPHVVFVPAGAEA